MQSKWLARYLNGWGSSCPARKDYESFNGMHNFIITHAGTRFRIQFAEQALLTRSMEQLEQTICELLSECCATLRFGHFKARIATILRVALRVTSFGYSISGSNCAQAAVVVSLIFATADVLLTQYAQN